MIGSSQFFTGGRALAGLALCLCACACDSERDQRGPEAASEGETAALLDAEAMLDAREPAEGDAGAAPEAAPEP